MKTKDIKKLLKTEPYDFLRTNEHLGDNIMLLTIGGSHAYGTSNPDSDIDIRGIATERPKEIIGLSSFEQVIDSTTDTTIYSFRKIVSLMLNMNPNTIELLGTNDDMIFYINQYGKMLKDNLDLFLSQRAISSFGGYATQQLRRLENALANDHYPQSEKEKHIANSIRNQFSHFERTYTSFDKGSIVLNVKPSSRDNMDSEIYMDINIKDYPLRDFKAIYAEMSNVVKDYDKLNHRNRKKDDLHLNKHAMHLVRLMLMLIDILTTGEVITYRGKDLELLMNIRNGKYQKTDGSYYPEFFELVTKLQNDIDYAIKHTVLKPEPNIKKIEELVMDINKQIIMNK